MNMEPGWYAIYTKSRHEKKVADDLARKGIEVFLPLRKILSQWKDRRKEVQIPLFSGYVFVQISANERLIVLQTPGVVHFVGRNENLAEPIPVDQIQSIQKLVDSGLRYDPYPYLKEGMHVTIKRGPMKGVEGILIGKRKKHMLVLSVDLIQQSAALQVDISDTDVG